MHSHFTYCHKRYEYISGKRRKKAQHEYFVEYITLFHIWWQIKRWGMGTFWLPLSPLAQPPPPPPQVGKIQSSSFLIRIIFFPFSTFFFFPIWGGRGSYPPGPPPPPLATTLFLVNKVFVRHISEPIYIPSQKDPHNDIKYGKENIVPPNKRIFYF